MSPLAPRPHAAPANELGRLTALLDGLPTLPIVSIRLGEVLHARRSTVDQVAELIGADPSLSAKLLRLVNSSYFGIPGGVTTIAQAIPFVGFNTIYQLALSVSVLETLHTPSGGVYDRPLWLHSLAVAAAARVVAEDLRHADPGSLFTAGLLHDMGKIALAKLAPDQFLRSIEVAEQEGLSSPAAEVRVGLPTHHRVGADLARRWRLPASLIAPIENHHGILEPELRARLTAPARVGAEIVAVADLIGGAVSHTAGEAPTSIVDPTPVRALLDALGVSDAKRDSLHRRVMLELERSRPFLDLLG